jgi:hypothetical protein
LIPNRTYFLVHPLHFNWRQLPGLFCLPLH